MVHASRDLADLRMQRAAEGDVHLLQARQMPNSGTPRADAGLRQSERDLVAIDIIGLVLGVWFGIEARRMHIGARPRQHDAIDHVQQRTDIGDVRLAGEHQRQRAGDFRDRAQIALADHLDRKSVLDAIGVPDHTDHRLSLPFPPLRQS